MKALLLAILLAVPGLAKADFSCSKGPLPSTMISYSSANHLYFVTLEGFRVNFAAYYKAVAVVDLPGDTVTVSLMKTIDQSTYSNMPSHLEFKVDGKSAQLSGLKIYVYSPDAEVFAPSDCAQQN